MASRLPSIDLRGTTQQIGVVRASDANVRLWGAVAEEAGALGQMFQEQVNKEAAAKGQKAVTRDENGNLNVEMSSGFGQAAEAYNNAAKASYLAQIAPQVRQKLAEEAQNAGFDLEKFQAATQGVTEAFVGSAPDEVASEIQGLVTREAEREGNALVSRKQQHDVKVAQGSLLAEMENVENRLAGYAAQGNLNSPEAQRLLDDYRGLLDVQVGNPLFAMDEKQAGFQMQALESRLMATTAGSQAVRVFNAHGMQAAEKYVNETINDPSLNLSASERKAYSREAMYAVRQRQADIRSAQAEAQAKLSGTINDAEAMASRTGEWRSHITEREILNAYGSERGQKIIDGLDFQADTYRAGQEIIDATPDEINRLLDESRPQGEGFADEAKRYDALTKAVIQRNKLLAADPAGYVIANVPRIREAFDLATDPESTQRAVSEMIAEQQRLGVRPDLIQPLPKDKAASIVGAYTSAEQPQDQADLIGSLSILYGKDWPRVATQLADAGLPGGADVMATLTKPGQEIARTRLAEAIAAGPKDLKNVIGSDAVKSVDAALVDEMAPLAQTLALQPGGTRIAAEFNKQAATLAYKYVSEGMDASTAASQAASDLANSQYSFHGTYRVPAEYDGTVIEDAASAALQGLDMIDLAPVPSLDSRMDEKTAASLYRDAVKSNGYWLTNEDETGLYLVDEQGKPVTAADGSPVEYSFDELSAMPVPESIPGSSSRAPYRPGGR